jgi:hypothetical protein
LGVKILKFFDEDPGFGMETVRIRDGKKSDPGSGINIPDPPHCRKVCWILSWTRCSLAAYEEHLQWRTHHDTVVLEFVRKISNKKNSSPIL